MNTTQDAVVTGGSLPGYTAKTFSVSGYINRTVSAAAPNPAYAVSYGNHWVYYDLDFSCTPNGTNATFTYEFPSIPNNPLFPVTARANKLYKDWSFAAATIAIIPDTTSYVANTLSKKEYTMVLTPGKYRLETVWYWTADNNYGWLGGTFSVKYQFDFKAL